MSRLELVRSAVKSLGYCATAVDVAVKAGIGIEEANTALNELASTANACLKISEEGTIFYDFSGKSLDAQTNLVPAWMLGYWRCFCYVAFFVTRVSFGLMLLFPAVLTIMGILFVIFSVLAMAVWYSEHIMMMMGLGAMTAMVLALLGEDISRYLGKLPFSFLELGGLKRFFSFEMRELVSCFEPSITGDKTTFASALKKKVYTGFANDVFAYAFGPGISQKYQENVRWSYVAALLLKNKGAVIEEQLAPFTANYVNDGNDIFKVLMKFDGRPQVSKNGNIIYLFPNLDVSAWETLNGNLPRYFREEPKLFAGLDSIQLLRIYSFSLFNLLAAYWLERYGINMAELEGAAWFIHLFSAYAVFFFAFPLVRLAFFFIANSYIEQRNRYRSLLADLLVNPEKDIRLKLKDQAKYATDSCMVMPSKIVYSTDEESLAQE